MMYSGVRTQLEGVIEWLEKYDQQRDEGSWMDMGNEVVECIAALNGMAKPLVRQDKHPGRSAPQVQHDPNREKYLAAVRLLWDMTGQMRVRNRADAIETARAALAGLPLH